MGFFDGTNKADPRGQSNKLKPGRYPRLTIRECKWVNGFSGQYYVVNLSVDAEPIQTDPNVEPHGLGSNPDWTTRMDDQYRIGPSEAKAFALAVLGTDDETTDVEGPLEQSLKGGFKGKVVSCSAFHKTTQSGRQITVCMFGPAEGPSAPVPPPALASVETPETPETPETAEGGPWYAFPSPDARGTHYNASGDCRTFG